MKKILIIDDDPVTLKTVAKFLENDFDTEILNPSDHEKSVLECIRLFKPNLILLDVLMPVVNGFEIIAKMKEDPELRIIPVVFLTSKEDISDKTIAFKLGANDYITKPCNPTELRLRVDANINKVIVPSEFEEDEASFVKLCFRVDYGRHLIEVKENEKYVELELTQMEFKLLNFFIKNEGRVLSRDKILDFLGKGETFSTDRSIDVHLASLRKKHPKIKESIKTIYGVGYKLEID